MALHIRHGETDRLVRESAKRKGIGLTDAIKLAVRNEIRNMALPERIGPLLARLDAMQRTGLKADNAFLDELSGC
jgi:antitoxin VapB